MCGILAGGLLGVHMTAFGFGFGLNCINFQHMNVLSTAIGFISLIKCQYRIIGIFHMASMMFVALYSNKISPYVAYGATLGIICSMMPSSLLASWITAIYVYNVLYEKGLCSANE
jgi:hypothetical protein